LLWWYCVRADNTAMQHWPLYWSTPAIA